MNFFLLIISFLIIPIQAHFSGYEKLLNDGLKQEDKGQYEKALEIWATALTELETPSLAIGREYIRLTTEQNLRTYYENASSIYLWGLSADHITSDKDALEQELAMLQLLTEQSTYRRWQQLLKENNPELYRELRRFWQIIDSTPGTLYNERLIEHWERIAYARKHYNRRHDPPYGTDDRGAEYIRYGQPDRTRSGYLELPRGSVYSECASLPGCSPETMANVVMNLDTNPYYEIWIYTQPNQEMQYNLVMIFGEKPLSGFGKVETIEDFIPSSAFTLSKRFNNASPVTGSNSPGSLFTPGMIMQWMYYQQLATVDFFFADRFSQLAFLWEGDPSDPRKGKHQGPIQEQRSETITVENLKKAPPEISTYEKLIPTIPLQAYHYRLLDEENQPVIITFLESQPLQVFLNDMAFNEDVFFPDDSVTAEKAFGSYELLHGLRMVGRNGEIRSSVRQPAELILDFKENLPSSSVFSVPYMEDNQQIILYAELHNRHSDSHPKIETAFPSSLRGIGKSEENLPEPLFTDPNILEMGDLILGYQMRSNYKKDVLFPFVVANNREIPEGEELAVHIGIYNLQRGEDGLTSFRIDYEILPIRRMEWLRGKKHEFSLTLNQQTTGSQFVENLEILTRNLQPGPYKLKLQTTDNTSGQQTAREIEFRVVKAMKAD